jgi:hypothetical protein
VKTTTVPLFPKVVIDTRRMIDTRNAYAWIGAATVAMQRAGINAKTIQKFEDEAMADDYDHLLATVRKWVTVK